MGRPRDENALLLCVYAHMRVHLCARMREPALGREEGEGWIFSAMCPLQERSYN